MNEEKQAPPRVFTYESEPGFLDGVLVGNPKTIDLLERRLEDYQALEHKLVETERKLAEAEKLIDQAAVLLMKQQDTGLTDEEIDDWLEREEKFELKTTTGDRCKHDVQGTDCFECHPTTGDSEVKG